MILLSFLQSIAVGLLRRTLDFMSSEVTNSSTDRLVVENLGTSLMFGITNVLTAISEEARANPGKSLESRSKQEV